MHPRLVIVSLGAIGRRHLRNARKLLPDAEILVLRRAPGPAPEGADRQTDSLAEAVAFAPDLAILATPAPFRAESAGAFLDAGAQLFLEKPIAATAREAMALSAAIKRSGRKAAIGYNLRFVPVVAEARQRIMDGEIGAPRLARFEVGQYLPDWRPETDYREGVSAQRSLGGGALLELSHELDLAHWFLGPPERVTAVAGRISSLKINVEDHATVILEHRGHVAVAQMDFLQRTPRRRILVSGEDGAIEIDVIAQTGEILRPDGARQPLESPPTRGEDDCYLRQFDAVFAACIDGYAPRFPPVAEPCTAPEAAAVLETVAKAKVAAGLATEPIGQTSNAPLGEHK